MSRRQAGISLAAGLVLLVAAPVAWAGLTPDPAGETVTDLNAEAARALVASTVTPDTTVSDVTSVTTAAAGSDSSSPSATSGSSAPVTSVTGTAESSVVPPAVSDPVADTSMSGEVSAPAPVTPPAVVPATPVRLQLPTLGIDNPVLPVGVTDSGDLEIPDDVDDVGWYRFGPLPGAAVGSAVLTGHVDDARQGAGPLSRLGELAQGDVIVVVDEAGVSWSFTVLAREEWSKTAVPMDRLFDRGGSPRLVLITCGGEFDRSTGHYEDNIAITAVPVTGASPGGSG